MDHITARGHVDAFLVSKDGTMIPVESGHNTLSYACADTVAGLFAGIVTSRPTTIGFVWAGDAGKATVFHFTEGQRVQKQGDIAKEEEGLYVHDVTIDPNVKFSSSDDSKYEGNTVTFSATTKDNANKEYIYGVILKDGAGPDAKVLAVKRMVKDKTTNTPVERPAGYAMAVSWGVTFI